MGLLEPVWALCIAWGVALAHAVLLTVATYLELRTRSSPEKTCLLAAATFPGCLLFAELAIRYGEVRTPEDLLTLGIAFFGSFVGLLCIVFAACVHSERTPYAVRVAQTSWLLAWAASSAVTCSIAVGI